LAVVAVVIEVLLANRARRAAALALLAALGAIAIGGHANSASPRALALTSDWAHLLAATVWVGGIAQITVTWLPGVRALTTAAPPSSPSWRTRPATAVVCSQTRSREISSRMRMQGSCCFPMNLAAYKSQVQGLRAYAGVPQIPRDPYDVPVSLVKRLLADDRAIRLGPARAQIYSHAMHMSRLKGPCCCHCWRWYAFRGLGKYLIADLRWRQRGSRP
jgi:hypothetical protein